MSFFLHLALFIKVIQYYPSVIKYHIAEDHFIHRYGFAGICCLAFYPCDDDIAQPCREIWTSKNRACGPIYVPYSA